MFFVRPHRDLLPPHKTLVSARKRTASLLLLGLLAGQALPARGAAQPAGSNFVSQDAMTRFSDWWDDYARRKTPLRLSSPATSQPLPHRWPSQSQTAIRLENLLQDLIESSPEASAEFLLEVATFSFRSEQDEQQEFQRDREFHPWRIRRLARKALSKLETRVLSPLKAKALDSKESTARRLVLLEALGHHPDLKPLYPLSVCVTSLSPALQVGALRGLLALDDPDGLSHLERFFRKQDKNQEASTPQIRMMAAAVIESVVRSAPLLERQRQRAIRLGDLALQDREWIVRLQAARWLRQLRQKETVPLLINALKRERHALNSPRAHQRVRDEIQEALESLTGAYHDPEDSLGWSTWLENNVDFSIPEERATTDKPLTQGGSFFDLDLGSNHLTFILDNSQSMGEPFIQKDTKGAQPSLSKWDRVLNEIAQAMMALPAKSRVRFVVFEEQVRSWTCDDASLSSSRNKAISWLRAQNPKGRTNLFDGLVSSFHPSERQGRKWIDFPYPQVSAIDSDTLVLISDGAPTEGPVIDPAEILRTIDEYRQFVPVRIHALSLGDEPSVFLQELAKRNQGTYRHLANS